MLTQHCQPKLPKADAQAQGAGLIDVDTAIKSAREDTSQAVLARRSGQATKKSSAGSWVGRRLVRHHVVGQHLVRQHLVRQHLVRLHLVRQHLVRVDLVRLHLVRRRPGPAPRGRRDPGVAT